MKQKMSINITRGLILLFQNPFTARALQPFIYSKKIISESFSYLAFKPCQSNWLLIELARWLQKNGSILIKRMVLEHFFCNQSPF